MSRQPQQTNACGVISLIFSLISIFLSACLGAGLVFGIPAFILGIIGTKEKNMQTGTAIAGLVISIFGCLISIVFIFIYGSNGAFGTGVQEIVNAIIHFIWGE